MSLRETSLFFVRRVLEWAEEGSLFAFYGRHHDPLELDTVLPDAPRWNTIDPYRDMIFGVSLGPDDLSLMIRDVPWVSGVKYAPWDDSNPDLLDSDFYVSVKQGEWYHVYLCLDAPGTSTVEPDFGDVIPELLTINTSDGYRWRYLTTVAESFVERHDHPGMIPLVVNAAAQEMAVPGAVESVLVLDPGEGYVNQLSGVFAGQHVGVSGNSSVFNLTSNSSSSTSNGFYTGCLLSIVGGTGAGQHRRIVNYVSSNTGRLAVVESPFQVTPTGGSSWEVAPEVVISGSGEETTRALARAILQGGLVRRVEILSAGEGYVDATAVVAANSAVGVTTPAVVRPAMAPPGGHGSDVESQLGACCLSVSAITTGDESGTIPATGVFSQVGLITTPLFTDVELELTSYGTFTDGWEVSTLDLSLVATGGVTITVANTQVEIPLGMAEAFSPGELFLAVEGDERFFSRVTSANSTHVTLAHAPSWVGLGDAAVYRAQVSASAEIETSIPGGVRVASLSGRLSVGQEIYSLGTSRWAVIDAISRSGLEKGQSTFVGAHQIVAQPVSGTIVDGEIVYQGATLPTATFTARVHSWADDSGAVRILVTRVWGKFTTVGTGAALRGDQSGAVLTPLEIYHPEIEFGSGRVVALENVGEVTRSEDTSESVRFLLSLREMS